ncbi:MAG: hypothetical protein Q4C66_11930 [Lachnospiraceae bacterium]|nr:hypothetical protein [Lachnospiraceae bacterium]
MNEEQLAEAGITEKEISQVRLLDKNQLETVIRHMLSQGRTPFCQVFEGNVVSERLQQKLGLERSKQMTWWLF